MKRAVFFLGFLALACCVAASASAATRAWLDRNPVAIGQPVTLNIETDQVGATPDFAPLQADFELADQSSSRQLQMVNGAVSAKTLYAVTLLPRRNGDIAIPSLQVGAQRTNPLTVTVRGSAAPATIDGNATAFVETQVDDEHPYVQQTVGVTVRLYYAVPLASGQLDLDTPDGGALQRVGDDVQTEAERNGRRYNVVERRFLLVPDRSGALTVPAPRFVGRGAGGWFDDFIGGNGRELRATGAPRTLEVRPQPADAPQPWLPLRDLRLRYVAAPQSARAGEAATLTVEATAIGATQSQLPELPVPSVPGAQVFAEPPQYDEGFKDGAPQVKLTRRYSLVPAGAGKLRVSGIRMAWWDVRDGAAKTASLPDLQLDVAPGSGGFAGNAAPAPAAGAADAAAAAPSDAGAIAPAPPSRVPASVWPWLAAGFALLWLATLVWALLRRRDAGPARGDGGVTPAAAGAARTLPDLRKALDGGGFDEIGEILCAMATPPATDLDALLPRLDDPVQRDAIEHMRRARWADGDGTAARAALRAAFRNGPAWRSTGNGPGTGRREPILPPLYPERGR